MIVVDASPLIALSKIHRVELLKDLFGQGIFGPVVDREVVERGRISDPVGVRWVEAALRPQWIRQILPTAEEEAMAAQLETNGRLGPGEAEALAIAMARKLPVVLDDKQARTVAKSMGVRHVGTAGILLRGFVERMIGEDELTEAVRDLAMVLWLSPDVVAEILRIARSMKR